jgi:hypothetical protein
MSKPPIKVLFAPDHFLYLVALAEQTLALLIEPDPPL